MEYNFATPTDPTLTEGHEVGDLADAIELARSAECDVDLYDAAGWRCGWVHPDGSYRLQ